MKVLTVQAGYGTLIAAGIKIHETRRWWTAFRGWLAIHQGATWGRCAKELEHALTERILDRKQLALRRLIVRHLHERAGINAIVAIARVVECVPAVAVAARTTRLDWLAGDFGRGCFAWRFADVKPFDAPVPFCDLRHGLFDIESTRLSIDSWPEEIAACAQEVVSTVM